MTFLSLGFPNHANDRLLKIGNPQLKYRAAVFFCIFCIFAVYSLLLLPELCQVYAEPDQN